MRFSVQFNLAIQIPVRIWIAAPDLFPAKVTGQVTSRNRVSRLVLEVYTLEPGHIPGNSLEDHPQVT